MQLKLKRPLVFFDLETTGLNIGSDRIVELSYFKLFPDYSSETRTWRVNPEMHIPEAVSKVHGITDDDVRECPVFAQIAKDVEKTIEGCDLAGYNSNNFDIPLLAEELLRAGVDFDLHKCRFIDAFSIFQKHEPRTLTAAYRFYCGKELEDAHSANADTMATFEVLQAQLDRYPDLPDTVEALSDCTTLHQYADFAGKIGYDNCGQEIFNFGKYKGQQLSEVFLKDTGYYGWLINADFPAYTKKVFTKVFVETRQKN